MRDKINIPKILKAHRRRMGFTQKEMAALLGMSRPRLGSYEEGRARPGVDDLVLMSRRLGHSTLDAFLNLKNPDGQVDAAPVIMSRYHLLPADKKKIVDFILQLS